MDFSLTPEQKAIRDSVRQYCRENYSFRSRMMLLHSELGFSRDHWTTFGELGWIGAGFPEDVDGFGGSVIESAIILEEFGRALVLEPYLSCAVLAGQALNFSGDEARKKILPALVNSKIILGMAHFEPTSAGCMELVQTRALPSSGCGYVLTGTKSSILGGPSADKFLISARTSGNDRDDDGVSMFLVDKDTAGITRTDYRLIDGARVSDLTLNNVQICEEALVGVAGAALPAIRYAFDHAIVCSCAEAVGAMDNVLSLTSEHLKGRDQSGAPLSTYQALQHRMADMLVETEMARSALHMGLSALSQPDPRLRRKATAACKVQVSHSARFVGGNGIQLHGAIGMTDEHRIGQYFKRLTVLSTFLGSTDFQLEQFASLS